MKDVLALVGAGQIGMAIARRMGYGKKIILGDRRIAEAPYTSTREYPRHHSRLSNGKALQCETSLEYRSWKRKFLSVK